jgi:hypothetical protein
VVWKATDVRKRGRTSISRGLGHQIGVLLKDKHVGNFEVHIGFVFLYRRLEVLNFSFSLEVEMKRKNQFAIERSCSKTFWL